MTFSVAFPWFLRFKYALVITLLRVSHYFRSFFCQLISRSFRQVKWQENMRTEGKYWPYNTRQICDNYLIPNVQNIYCLLIHHLLMGAKKRVRINFCRKLWFNCFDLIFRFFLGMEIECSFFVLSKNTKLATRV